MEVGEWRVEGGWWREAAIKRLAQLSSILYPGVSRERETVQAAPADLLEAIGRQSEAHRLLYHSA